MSEKIALKTEETQSPALSTDLRAEKAQSLQHKISGLGALRVTSVTSTPTSSKPDPEVTAQPTAPQFDIEDEESVILLNPANNAVPMAEASETMQMVYLGGAVLTGGW